jgi:glucose-6-phosphate isomerase
VVFFFILRRLSQVDGVDASSTLVVVVSKSFTTAETIMNAKTVKDWLTSSIKANATDVVRQHVAAVSTQMQLTADFGIAPENVFAFGDYVGGRFSVHSPVGVLPLALQYGMAPLREFLSGAHAMDLHFKNTPLEKNLPVLLGLLGLYNSTFLGYNCKAILPYAQALLRFAAHVQQLDMESNGKRVAMDGSTLSFEAGEIQCLHQIVAARYAIDAMPARWRGGVRHPPHFATADIMAFTPSTRRVHPPR